MTTTLLRTVAAFALLLGGTTLAGCSSSSDDGASDGASAGAGPSDSAPTGSPFSSEMSGPTEAESGDRLVVTLTNTGRLPDAYQVAIDPTGAATLTETEFRLGPGESVKFGIDVERTPFAVRLKSVGGGMPELVALTVD